MLAFEFWESKTNKNQHPVHYSIFIQKVVYSSLQHKTLNSAFLDLAELVEDL